MRGSLPEMVDPGKNITFPLGSTMMWTGEMSHSGPKAHCPTAEGICAAAERVQHPSSTNSKARNFRRFTLGGSCGTTFGSSRSRYWRTPSSPRC